MSAVIALSDRRIAVSPYARRLANERGIALEDLTGTGPGGRIVAADIVAFVPQAKAAPRTSAGPQAAALATTISLATMRQLLSGFTTADTTFSLEDVALRAAGCALDDVAAATSLPGAPVALETKFGEVRAQAVFADIRKGSLGPLRQRRLDALAAATDASAEPAALSLKVLEASDIRPVTMPLLPGRDMRLVLIAGEASAECLLAFDPGVVDEDAATEVLSRFKAYLEVPIRLLA
ncbi:MAG TPA: E3 binding domain-containing protein [Devosia sp.]|nr:E3 binding domain-containing protein [Devosia sp.]